MGAYHIKWSHRASAAAHRPQAGRPLSSAHASIAPAVARDPVARRRCHGPVSAIADTRANNCTRSSIARGSGSCPRARRRPRRSGDLRWNDRWDDVGLAAFERRQAHRQAVLKRAGRHTSRVAAAGRSNALRRLQVSVRHDGRSLRAPLSSDPHGDLRRRPEQRADSSTTCASRRSRTTRTGSRGSTGFPAYVDQNIALLREGLRTNTLLPKVIVVESAAADRERWPRSRRRTSGYYKPFTTVSRRRDGRRPRASCRGGARSRSRARPAGLCVAARRFSRTTTCQPVPTASAGRRPVAARPAMPSSRGSSRRRR